MKKERPRFKNLDEAVTAVSAMALDHMLKRVHDDDLSPEERKKMLRTLKSHGVSEAAIDGARRK